MSEPKSSEELDRLLNALVDQQLTDVEETRLAELLRQDASGRRRYRIFMELHGALHWDYAAAVTSPAGEPASPSVRLDRRMASWFAWAAAAVVLFATGYYWATTTLRTSDAPLIAQLESIEGAVTWSVNGTRRSDLTAGARLPAGTLILEGESASAVLRFHDGTALTLCGDTELEFSDDGQKRLALKSGTLSVDARPQPTGRPMIVRTQTAEIEVVGTVFSLSADTQATQLSVETGRVRMRRLADGKSVDVADSQTATATLDSVESLQAHAPQTPSTSICYRFSEPLPSNWKGERIPADAADPDRVRAVPCVVGRKADGAPVVQYGISVRGHTGRVAALRPASVINVRFRSEQRVPLRIMLTVQRPNGSFGGNFEKSVDIDEGEESTNGWRRVTIPLSEFRPLIPRFAKPPQNGEVSLVFLSTFQISAQLEMSELAFEVSQ
jgi:ferric-dicitrate binding protein FerR (iron transport regulator)